MHLCIDTSTPFVSVALATPGGDVVAEANRVGPMQHGELLLPTIVDVLGRANAVRTDLTQVLVGVGPGPYTGLRVGVVTALTLAHALQIPIAGVLSLDGLGYAHREHESAWVTSDARRKEVFAARVEHGQRVGEVVVLKPADLDPAGLVVLGAAPVLYPEIFAPSSGPDVVTAADLVRAVASGSASTCAAAPLYLRRPDAQIPAAAKRVS